MAQQSSRRVGSLRVAADDEEFEDIRSELTALQRAGFGAEEYEGPEGAGLLLPYDGVCNPLERCRGMARANIESGARLFENSPVIDIDTGIVRTPEGMVEVDSVVVAIDGRLEVLFPELSSRIKTVRLEMLATEPFDIKFTRPVYTQWGYNYWQQLVDGRLAIGGLRHEHEDASYTTEDGPSDSLQAGLDRYVLSLGVNAAITHRWAGHAGFTEDRLPIYEELKPGVWVVGGYSGHGNVMGAMYGRAATRSAVIGEMEPML